MNESASNFSIMSLVEPGMMVCEIGIRVGESSKNFLEKGCFLYMIDPWEGYKEYTESEFYHFEEDYKQTLENIKEFEGNYKIIKKKSDDAVNDVPNNLGLIYIDGNHSYEFVKRDIAHYWPKVKKKGWLTGDDISMEEVSRAVMEAMIELVKENPEMRLGLFGRNWGIQKL